MSKTETPKISVTKRDAINGDITEQIKFVSDVRERITNLKMEEKVDDGGRKTYYAEWIWWLITHYKLPKASDIITSDEGQLRTSIFRQYRRGPKFPVRRIPRIQIRIP